LSVKVKAPKSFVWLLFVWCLYGSWAKANLSKTCRK